MKKKYTKENLERFFSNYSIIKEILSEKEINDTYNEWKSNNTVNFHDYLWLLFNKAILKNGELLKKEENLKKFYQNNYFIYWKMGRFISEDGGSKNEINKFIRMAFEEQINEIPLSSIVQEIKVLTDPHERCDYSKNLNILRYEYEDFVHDCHIAKEVCTNEYGCNCCLSIVPKRDLNGRFMRKEENKIQNIKNENSGCFTIIAIIVIIFQTLI